MIASLIKSVENRLTKVDTRTVRRLAEKASAEFTAEQAERWLDLTTTDPATLSPEQVAERDQLSRIHDQIQRDKDRYREALDKRQAKVNARKEVFAFLRRSIGYEADPELAMAGELRVDAWISRMGARMGRFLGYSNRTLRQVTDWVKRPANTAWRIVRAIVAAPAYVVLVALQVVRIAVTAAMSIASTVLALVAGLILLVVAAISALLMSVISLIARIPFIGRPIATVLSIAVLLVSGTIGVLLGMITSIPSAISGIVVAVHNAILFVLRTPFTGTARLVRRFRKPQEAAETPQEAPSAPEEAPEAPEATNRAQRRAQARRARRSAAA